MAYEFETKTVELLVGYKDKDGTVHTEAEIREMVGIDEEDIQKPDIRANVGRIITTVLRNCVVRIGSLEKSSMKLAQWEKIMRDLFIADRDLLMMEIRKFSYGDELEMPVRCPYCKNEATHILEWDEIEIEKPKTNPDEVSFELKKGVLDGEGNRVKEGTLRLPKGEDQELLDNIARKNMGQANTSLITRCVTSLGDIKLSSKVFKNMSTVDREAIVETIADNSFGPNFKVEIDCPSCGETFDTGVNPVNFL